MGFHTAGYSHLDTHIHSRERIVAAGISNVQKLYTNRFQNEKPIDEEVGTADLEGRQLILPKNLHPRQQRNDKLPPTINLITSATMPLYFHSLVGNGIHQELLDL